MTWPEGEDRMQGGDVAATGGEDEKVGVAVGDESALGLWLGELPLVNGEVSCEPVGGSG